MVDRGVSSQGVLLQSFCVLALALTLALTLMILMILRQPLVLTLAKHNPLLPHLIREIRKRLLILLGTP